MIGGKATRDVVNHTFGEALPATSSRFPTVFSVPEVGQTQGMTLEGTVVEMRHHTLVDEKKTYHRFLAIVLDVKSGRNRTFDDKGQEIETEQKRLAMGRQGYLTWDAKVKEDPNELKLNQIAVRLGSVGLRKGLYDEGASKLHPNVPNRFEFWCDRQLMTSSKVAVGEVIRLKTHGASHFADGIWRADSTPLTQGTSYAGENVESSWTNKLMQEKQKIKEEPKKSDPNKEAVADDEW